MKFFLILRLWASLIEMANLIEELLGIVPVKIDASPVDVHNPGKKGMGSAGLLAAKEVTGLHGATKK